MDVALAVGSSVLSAFLQVVFDRMATKEFVNLFREKKSDKQLLQKLKLSLLAVEAVLDDAENKQTRNRSVKGWLDELHDTIYEADDLLDEINTEALRLKIEVEHQSSTSHVSASTYSSSSSTDFLKKVMPEIEKMVVRLDWFIQQINPMGLQAVEPKMQSCRMPSTSLVDETTVYGRDVDKEKILEMLLSESANGINIRVIPLVGPGGIGKTTLAQLVYNDKRVQDHFPTKAWVYISDNYDATRITKELLGALHIPISDASENLNSLQVKLQSGLTGKKFLLVLDDCWNRAFNDWDKLKVLFKGGLKGSKIIVTTRHKDIGMMMSKKESIYHLDLIKEEDCWSLFEKYAFEYRDGNQSPELEEIGKKIVKKCGGLPLAVKTVAGLLRSKTTAEEWEDILVSEVWTQPANGILPVLRLSYSHLPSHLKRCFACCAVFHKDYRFRKEEIVHLWQANDLLEPLGDNRGIEQIGEEYLRELRLRSLLEQSTDSVFSMHDLVNDLARFVSGSYCFRLEDRDQRHGKICRVSNFSYHPSFYDAFNKLELLSEAKNLRTFLPLLKRNYCPQRLSHKFLHEILPKFRSLRFLSLLRYNIRKLPDSISHLQHLRFLNLSGTDVEILPECICTLYNLQTFLLSNCRKLKELPIGLAKLINMSYLDLSGTPLEKMPPYMGRLRNLRFLNLSRTNVEVLPECVCTLDNLQTFLLSNCQKLEELPVSLAKLINLSYLDISGTPLKKMPPYMSRLRNLRVLTNFTVGRDSGLMIEELGKFVKLHGGLFISKLENVCSGREASMANLKGKKHLNKLTLEWSGDTDDSQVARDVLDNLQPHSSIKHLKIIRYGGTTFPNWLGSPSLSHLESLSLSSCKCCVSLPALGQLKSLQSLEIVEMGYVSDLTEDFYGDISVTKPFPSLKELRIEKLPEWERWHIPECEVFNRLEWLRIIDCPKLIGELPQQLSSLEILRISGCDNLVRPNGQLSIFNGEIQQKFSSLRELKISRLQNLKELPLQLNQLSRLERFSFHNCGSLSPSHVSRPQLECWECHNLEGGGTLTTLKIDNCDSLKVKVEWLASFPMPYQLDIKNCKRIEMLSSNPAATRIEMTSLRRLFITDCDDQMPFPEGGLAAPNLTQIRIYHCKKLKSLPKQMESLLPSLHYLYLSDCPEIECFPEGGLPSSLRLLSIDNCKRLMSRWREWGLEKLPSLTHLYIQGPCDEVESFPEQDRLLPCTLQFLRLGSLENLKVLNYLGLQHLTSLQNLCIGYCPRLQSLPQEGLPASLTELIISGCPKLKPRLEREKGQDWPKVAHIPCVDVDWERMPIP